jgi:hypothetical protein
MNKYQLKMYTWINGMLTMTRHEFEDLESAIAHAERKMAHSFKIFDADRNLCYTNSHKSVSQNTYA